MLGGIMLAGTVYVLSSYATLSLMGIECSEKIPAGGIVFCVDCPVFRNTRSMGRGI